MNDINEKNESLSCLIEEYNEVIQLIKYDKIKNDGYYKNIYYANGLSSDKPKLNFFLLIASLIIFLPSVSFLFEKEEFIYKIIFALCFFIFLVVSAIIISKYKKKKVKWMEINKTLNQLKEENSYRIDELKNKIKQYNNSFNKQLDNDELIDCCGKERNDIGKELNHLDKKNENININIFNPIINDEINKNEIKMKKCVFCNSLNKNESLKCIYCGGNLFDSEK